MKSAPALTRCSREGCRGVLFPEDVRGPDGFWRVEWTCFSCSHSPEPPPPFEEPVREVKPIPNPRQEAAMRKVSESKRLHRKTA